MHKTIMTLFLLFVSSSAYAAEWRGGLDIGQIRLDDTYAYFSTTAQPPLTCNLWGEYILFDYKTDTGKAYYSALLSAKAAKQKIDVWYDVSTAPGTDHNTGCTINSSARLISLRIR